MRGGKREGAGRKSLYPTKRITIPTELAPLIQKLIDDYKDKLSITPTETCLIKGKKSKEPAKTAFPIMTPSQLQRYRTFITKNNLVKRKSKAIELTSSHKNCYETFIKLAPMIDDFSEILDIAELYAVD